MGGVRIDELLPRYPNLVAISVYDLLLPNLRSKGKQTDDIRCVFDAGLMSMYRELTGCTNLRVVYLIVARVCLYNF